MSEHLIIRLPGKPVQHFRGEFKQVTVANDFEGFVFSDFTHSRIYALELSDLAEKADFEFHFKENEPYVISPRDYILEANALLNGFPIMGVDKAVYSRVKKHQFDSKDAIVAFNRACEMYPNACCYLVSSKFFGTWFGATPELLLNTVDDQWNTMALAGTRSSVTQEAWEEKEMLEHQYVIDAVVEALKRSDAADIQIEETREKIAGPVKHLYTPISAQGEPQKAWNFALDLHPTPAVCGTPRIASLDLLLSREMHEREMYAGMFGWVSKERTELYVNLRCAQLFENAAYLYVGGGYTKDSIPEKEWEETEHKANTLLKVFK